MRMKFNLSAFALKDLTETSMPIGDQIVRDASGNFGLSTSRNGRPKDFDQINSYFVEKVPPAIREAMAYLGYQSVYTNHIYDIYSREKGERQTDDYDGRKKNGQIGGWADDSHRIAFTARENWIGKRGIISDVTSTEDVQHTLLHELGHQFSFAFGRLENMVFFKAALEQDIQNYGGYERMRQTGHGYLTPSEARPDRHVSESWAELFAAAMGSEDRAARARAKMLPNAYQAVQEMILHTQHALERGLSPHEATRYLVYYDSPLYHADSRVSHGREDMRRRLENIFATRQQNLAQFNDHLEKFENLPNENYHGDLLIWLRSYVHLGNQEGVQGNVDSSALQEIAEVLGEIKIEPDESKLSGPQNSMLNFLIEKTVEEGAGGWVPDKETIEEAQSLFYVRLSEDATYKVHGHINLLPSVLATNSRRGLFEWIGNYIDLTQDSNHQARLDIELVGSISHQLRSLGFNPIYHESKEYFEKLVSEIIKASDNGQTPFCNSDIRNAYNQIILYEVLRKDAPLYKDMQIPVSPSQPAPF